MYPFCIFNCTVRRKNLPAFRPEHFFTFTENWSISIIYYSHISHPHAMTSVMLQSSNWSEDRRKPCQVLHGRQQCHRWHSKFINSVNWHYSLSIWSFKYTQSSQGKMSGMLQESACNVIPNKTSTTQPRFGTDPFIHKILEWVSSPLHFPGLL